MSLWQPKSLAQLVRISFFVALAPLSIAILFTLQTLGELVDKNREVTQVVVEATRLGQEIEHNALELERRARQYQAIADPELSGLFERDRGRLSTKLQSLQALMPTESPHINGLLSSLERLEISSFTSPAGTEIASAATTDQEQLDHEFFVINEQKKAVATWLQSSVDELLKTNSEEADSHIDALTLQLSLLAVVTLALLTVIAYWINKPVKDLTQEIQNLGTAGLSHPIEISGPLELQALGSELEWLRRGLHESELQKELFLRHISHELKTPLASLREGADLLAEQVTGHLSQQQLEIVEIVRQNGIALQRLIENLIDYNRLPHQDLSLEKIELKDLWRELLANYSLSLHKKALHLRQSGHEETWVADRYKLKTSLDNLLSNAINYTPEGGDIEIMWRAIGSNLLIDVANSGEPIPAEDAERVFQPFFQSIAKRSGPIKGSGIGLSVARECIEAQGGSLSLTTHQSLPVCFRIVCPAH
jgi:two-component system sensor histidine kinase GlrK